MDLHALHNFESAKGKSLILVVVTLGIPFDPVGTDGDDNNSRDRQVY